MLKPLSFAMALLLSMSAVASPPVMDEDLTKHWEYDGGECPQVLWIPSLAPTLKAVEAAEQVGDLLAEYPYQIMAQGSWLTVKLDGKVETLELQEDSGTSQLFKNDRYLVSLLQQSCEDLNPRESVCEVSAVIRRLTVPEAKVMSLVEYYGCFDEPASASGTGPEPQP